MDWFEEQSKILEEIIEFIKPQIPHETFSSVLSYFCCYFNINIEYDNPNCPFITKHKHYYSNFINKLNYSSFKYANIIKNPSSQWTSGMFDGILHELCVRRKDFRYVFLYTPYKSDWYTLRTYEEKEWKEYSKDVVFIEHTNFY